MLPFCFEGGTEDVVVAVSGAAVALVSAGDELVAEAVVSVVGGGAVVVV